jgi:hypothetical protein
MPILLGYLPEFYAAHVHEYGELFTPDQWVGVGIVCKRNGDPDQIEDILLAIKAPRLTSTPFCRRLHVDRCWGDRHKPTKQIL